MQSVLVIYFCRAMHAQARSMTSCGVCPVSVTFAYCVETDGHSCYGMLIGNRTQAIEWYQFSMTSSDSTKYLTTERIAWPSATAELLVNDIFSPHNVGLYSIVVAC